MKNYGVQARSGWLCSLVLQSGESISCRWTDDLFHAWKGTEREAKALASFIAALIPSHMQEQLTVRPVR